MKLPKSKYKYVYALLSNGKQIYWVARVDRVVNRRLKKVRKVFKKEREAALGVDKFLISIKEDPVNILVRKK